MKKLYITLFGLFLAIGAHAQIDRSVMPKPGPAPEIQLKDPERFQLRNGLKVLIVENHKLPRVSIQLSLDNPPILEGEKSGVSSLTASLLGNGSKSIPKDAYNEEVDFLGATIDFGSQSAYASSLSKYFPRILELLADAAINPNFTQIEFDKEKEKLVTALKASEKDVSAIADRVQHTLAYGKDHPYGEFVTEESLEQVSLDDVIKFHANYFVPANAYLVIIGDVDIKETEKLVKQHFTPWTKSTPPSFSYSKPGNALYTQINFVDVPNAVQSEVSVQSLVELKMKDPDFLAATLANRILGGGGEGRLFLNLREDKAYTYGSYSSLGNDKYAPALFNAHASVRNAVTDSAVVEIFKEVEKIINTPVTEEELKNTKANYVGNFVMALEKPETIARYALNIETEGLPDDYYKTYLERLNAVTVEEIMNAAKKYLTTNNLRIVVTGKGSEVLDNLEKVRLNGNVVPTHYFDKFANKMERPEYSAELPVGTTAQTVLQKYIDAVGGRAKLEALESFALVAAAEMQGVKLDLEMKKTSKGQFMQDVKMMGTSMSKQVLNGDKGYIIMQGQRQEMEGDVLAAVKAESSPFPELDYLTGDVKLEGIETVEGKKAYKLKVSDKKSSYYDMETGLKVQDDVEMEVQGQKMSTSFSYGDYKEVSGILFPYLLIQHVGPQKIEFVISEVKVDEGVSAEDFK
tara:strand:- start:118660 stop:120729 length:2070 start_codon:yes stop_codon:yes gene_type:complete